MREAGYELIVLRESTAFARLRVHDRYGLAMDVDLAVNWRAEAPVEMSLGPVLSERDAVAGKLSAVYSRGEVRDFLDLDAIRSSGRYTDTDLLALGLQHDVGFDEEMFAAQLSRVMRFEPIEVEEYGVTPTQFENVQNRILSWAFALRA